MSDFIRQFRGSAREVAAWGLVFGSLLCQALPAKDVALCPHITLRGEGTVDLQQSEKLLVCGDPENPAWNHIPDNQAIFNLRTYLQQRGYNNPVFKVSAEAIVVEVGRQTIVTRFSTRGDEPGYDITRLRHIVGEVLTPSLLDQIRQRLREKLQARGHACPQITMEASSVTGEIVADLSFSPALGPALRPVQKLVQIERDPIEGVHSEVFSRYDAFHLGDPYNADYLAVTVQRILDDAIVQSAFFTARCESAGAVAREHFVPGPPRQVSFGIGVDTEQLLNFRASWKNARLGSAASFVNFIALASFRTQELDGSLSLYVFPEPSRFFLKPSFQVKHENLIPDEAITSRIRFGPAGKLDSQDLGMTFTLGPTLNMSRTFRGAAPGSAMFMSIGGQYEVTDHYYEFYRASPRRGFDLRVDGNFAEQDWLSNVSALLIKTRFEKLWNLGHWDPPLFVLGLRGVLGTTLTPENVNTSTVLTTDFRQFLGGSSDVRGFGLSELPGGSQVGGLTALYLGGELRLADILPWGLQPFVFLDGAVFSAQPFSIDGPVFYSPGAGIRWQSPFGVVRATLAHGYIARGSGVPASLSHWQGYFSFGEEF